jgi:uncharacterized membrane protein YciS (DUF1049 family)
MESPFLEMMIYGPIFGAVGTLIGFLIQRGANGVYAMMAAGFATGWLVAIIPKQKSDSQTVTQVTHNITEYVNRDYRVDWTPVVSNISHGAEIVATVFAVGLVLAFILYIFDRLEKRRLVKIFDQITDPEGRIKHMGTLTGAQSRALTLRRENLPAVTKPAE